MFMYRRIPGILIIIFVLLALAVSATAGPEQPAVSKKAGKIPVGVKPPSKIAFINDGDVWMMDADGKNRYCICEVRNARGAMSFSPDNKRIAFTREGLDRSNLPSGEGGGHRLNDIFIAYLDSARTNLNWWTRLTITLGAQNPQWSPDGSTIYCQNDIHAGKVDFIVPSHQIARIEAEGGNMEYVRKDWQLLTTNMSYPTFSPDGQKVAFVINFCPNPEKLSFQNYGVRVLDVDSIMIPEKRIRKPSPGLEKAFAPEFSPDGKWLAFVSNDMNNPGVFLCDPENTLNKRLVYTPPITQQIAAAPVGWSPDSKWLCFATIDGIIYTVDINGDNLTPLTGAGKYSYPAWSN